MPYLVRQWLNCLAQYAQMSLFRSSPANLPYSLPCLLLTLLAYSLVGLILLSELRSVFSIIAQIGLEVLLLSAFSLIGLRLTKKNERLLQTVSALIGVNLVISIVSLPIMYLLPEVEPEQPIDPLVLQLNLMLLLWNLAALSLIFKRSLEIRTLAAGFMSFNYFLLYELILLNLFA